MVKELNLRQYQLDAVDKSRSNIKNGVKNQIIMAPTGAGKTVIAAYLLKQAYEKQSYAVFICDRISLINQTSATLDLYGIPHGVIQADHWRNRPWERIQVCSAATLARRKFPDADLIIVDECHTQVTSTIKKISERNCITVGLTATPFSKGLGKHYDALVSVTTTNKLIEQGFLVPFRVFAASEPDMTGAKVVAGEWAEEDIVKRTTPIIGDCVAEYLKHGQGKKFIAFGVNVAHAEEMKKQFLAAGVITELYTYKEGDEARNTMVDEFRKPESYIQGLISVSALSKGFDVSDVEVIIMCRPLKNSLAEHIQILGRGLRPHDGKKECIVLDHSGNMMRFWDDMQDFFETSEVELDDGKKKPKKAKKLKEKKAKKCPKCFHIHEQFICPSCGFKPEIKSGVDRLAGELKEFNSTSTSKNTATQADKQTFYSELLGHAREKGYKEGWAYHAYKEKFGVYPSNSMTKTPKAPSPKTMSWIFSRQIAKSKAAQKSGKSYWKKARF